MDDRRYAGEVPCLPFPGPRPADEPDGFVPLRLVLCPGGLSVELKRPDAVLGRHSSADVRLPLPDVSRRHCRFLFAEGRWRVIDLDSLNGVQVNGEPVRQAELHHRDKLRVGGFVFEVDLRAGERTVCLPAAGAEETEAILRSIADALPADAGERRRAS